jgi:transposase
LLTLQVTRIRHRYTEPRRPQQNGKVDRSQRIDQEEFWSRHDFETFPDADTALETWERAYNVGLQQRAVGTLTLPDTRVYGRSR